MKWCSGSSKIRVRAVWHLFDLKSECLVFSRERGSLKERVPAKTWVRCIVGGDTMPVFTVGSRHKTLGEERAFASGPEMYYKGKRKMLLTCY